VSIPVTVGLKWCQRCQKSLCITKFPVDRSRPDGRWHACRDCNQRYWEERGKLLAIQRKLDCLMERAKNDRSGLRGLRKYRNTGGLDTLPAELRANAQEILNDSFARAEAEGLHLTQQQIAARRANAVSNAPRKGDRSWARRMWRFKGYRRAERTRMEQEARISETHDRNTAVKPRSKLLPIW
jgi:hypothetical protein